MNNLMYSTGRRERICLLFLARGRWGKILFLATIAVWSSTSSPASNRTPLGRAQWGRRGEERRAWKMQAQRMANEAVNQLDLWPTVWSKVVCGQQFLLILYRAGFQLTLCYSCKWGEPVLSKICDCCWRTLSVQSPRLENFIRCIQNGYKAHLLPWHIEQGEITLFQHIAISIPYIFVNVWTQGVCQVNTQLCD